MPTTYGSTQFGADGNLCLANVQQTNDPNASGRAWDYTYVGTESSINALASSLTSQGVRFRTASAGGEFSLTATYTGLDRDQDPSAETPTDSYGLDTEGVNVSIFAHPRATAEAASYISPAQYKKDIEDALAEGAVNPISETTYPFSATIYRALSRGQEYFELRRPILRRTRTFSARYADRADVEARQVAWRTSTLITAFALPADVSARLPADPDATDTPVGTVWVWRLTLDSSEYNIAQRQWTESKVWVFEAVDPNFYTVT